MNTERLHLLIAEDEEAHIEAIRRAYEATGADVEIRAVGTLREFRACALDRPPDLALIDLNLPDGSALEVLAHPPEDAPFPCLVMTAFGNQQIVAEVMKAGALDYVVKSPEAFATMPRTIDQSMRAWHLLQQHKQTAEDLRNSEEKYRLLAEHAQEAVYVVQHGRVVFANAMFAQMAGLAPSEVVGVSTEDFVAEEDRAMLREHHRQLIAGEKTPTPLDIQVHARKGADRWVSINAVPIPWNGQPATLNFATDITDRKRSEEERRASQQITEGIINAIPVRVFWKDKNLVFLGCNQAFARDAGFVDPKDLVGKDDFQMGWRKQAESYRADDRQVIRSGKPKLFIEEPQTTPDGKTLTLLTSKIPLRNAQGEITGVLGTYMDITARKRSEEQLQAMALRLQDIASNIPGVVYQLTVNRKGFFEVPFMSAGFEALFGRPVEGLDFASVWFDHMPPDDTASFKRSLAAAAKQMESWSMEFRILPPDGQIKWLRGSANPRKLPAGGILWSGVLLDITEQKLAREQAEQEQALNKAIIESIPGAFYMLDETGKYSRWNAYQRDHIVGKPDDQVALTNAADTIHPDDRALVQKKIANVLATGAEETVEGRVLLHGGPDFLWLLMTGRQMKIDGHPFLVGTGIDITQRKQAEELMAKQLDELRRWQAVTLGREGRVGELKREVNALAARLGQPPPYGSAEGK